MSSLAWIVVLGLAMALIALVGSLTFFIKEDLLKKSLLPMVALAAGALLGGAFFHMLPEAIERGHNSMGIWISLVLGFLVFFILEQFLHWRHTHNPSEAEPMTYLILLADGLHNFIGGVSVGATLLIDIRLGITAWIAAAAHEVPQELGDFAVLVHGGWSRTKALGFNFLSALTFPLGGVITYLVSNKFDILFLIPFAAGNFLYIAAADLIPEIKHASNIGRSVLHLVFFLFGLGLLLWIRLEGA